LDAYYAHRHDTARLLFNLDRSITFQRNFRKPCIITEFGGTPWADSLSLIKQQLHFVIWHGFFRGFAVSPMLWWFPLVEEQNLYSEFKSLSDFGRGESRSGVFYGSMNLGGAQGNAATSPSRPTEARRATSRYRSSYGRAPIATADAPLKFYQMRTEARMLGWVADQYFLLRNKKLHVLPPVRKGVSVPIRGLRAGKYQVSFHDCATGKVLSTLEYQVSAQGMLKLPDFQRDIAFKIVPVKK
jgi:hypothetical protein